MNKTRTFALGMLVSVAAAATMLVRAQSTDGYHAIQVFPVVVDTASFAQRFTFRNPGAAELTLQPKYFPADGTSASALTCPDVVLAPDSIKTFASLRALCPALPVGSQFGFLQSRTLNFDYTAPVYAGFSRVANPQGNGFAVEAFPAHVFTSALTVVSGIRRLAATPSAPAFQTNCFIANLNELAPVGVAPTTQVHYTLTTAAGATLGSNDVALAPGHIVRLLDVFSVAPAGDYNDASIRFSQLGPEEPGIMAFCTVQDNTSFGADFRIAKQEVADIGLAGSSTVLGAQDAHVARETTLAADEFGKSFTIPAGNGAHNTHLFYFQHPDYVSCGLENPQTHEPLTATDNLEMELMTWDFQVIAGGNNAVGFGPVDLGEKTDRNGGSNTRYKIQVEDADGSSPAVPRNYLLHCRSGSGHTLGELVQFNAFGDNF